MKHVELFPVLSLVLFCNSSLVLRLLNILSMLLTLLFSRRRFVQEAVQLSPVSRRLQNQGFPQGAPEEGALWVSKALAIQNETAIVIYPIATSIVLALSWRPYLRLGRR